MTEPARFGLHRRWLAPLAFMLAFAVSLAIASLIPPMQSPDEQSHLARGYMLSRGHWLLETPTNMSSGGLVDLNLWAFFDIHMSVAGKPTERLSDHWKGQAALLHWGGREIFFQAPGTGYYVPLVYAPQALGFWLARTLDLSIARSYQLVRALCLLTCLGLLAWAFRLVRPPVLALGFLLLPMSLFQMFSPTLDGITTCLAVLALSIFFRELQARQEPSLAYTWIFAGAVALLASSKVILLPLLALPFYLGWARHSRRHVYAGLAAAAVSLAWTLYAMAHTVDTRVPHLHTPTQLARHYVRYPLEFFQVMANTLGDPTFFQFYEQSFIGILGWLDTQLPEWSYPALWIALAACAAASLLAVRPGEALLARIALVAATIGSAVLVFLALLVTWTHEPAVKIEGVQGRYFIVPAVILAYAIGATLAPRGWRWPRALVLCATALLSMYVLLVTLLARYH